MARETGDRLISAIQKQNEKTAYFCTAENLSPNIAVHEIRKSFKRIRALLHFYDEIPDSAITQFKEAVKSSGRELSLLRESAVNVQLFEREISGNQFVDERKLREALDCLAHKNEDLIQDKFLGNGLCAEIRQFVTGFNTHVKSVKTPAKKQFFDQVLITYQKSFQLHNALPEDQPPHEMHELRKKMKRLWFQLDFLRFLHPRYFRMKTDQLNHISEFLGEDHDLFVFLQELKSDEMGFESDETQILENQVLHLRDLNLVKLNPRMNQFFNETPEAFEFKMKKIFKLD